MWNSDEQLDDLPYVMWNKESNWYFVLKQRKR